MMSIDAVGGVWRYAVDLASRLRDHHVESVFAGFGPRPSCEHVAEAEALGKLVWLDTPLDWTVQNEDSLARVPRLLADFAARESVDLLHLNLPSQAAGLDVPVPVLVVSHSCVVTWFAIVRGQEVPQDWRWQERLNRRGFERADRVLAPSHSHAEALKKSYPGVRHIEVVHNGSGAPTSDGGKADFVFAAGRWWDEGKNGAALDAAAAGIGWPVVMAGSNAGPNGQYLEVRNASHRGELGHAQTMELMRRAAIVISPSLYEPFGLAPLEAARNGAALVLADIPTYRELWNDAALFADPRDPAAFAHQVNLLAERPALRREMAGKAAARSRRFTLDKQAVAMNDIYRALRHRSHTLSAT
jgi:glycosyltransferase involved in cell wall biosynthesis